MANYKQCDLVKGDLRLSSVWVPEASATDGNVVDIFLHEELSEGWIVKNVYQHMVLSTVDILAI